HFEKELEDEVIYHKDLRPIEYVTGEMEGRLGAPIYGMYGVEDQLENYITPDGVTMTGMPWGLIGPPEDDNQSGFEWSGEWTVTYETFRDMGMAFGVAIILIYMLVVMEFGNFSLPAVIMAPIPLTLVGIIPGHWLFGAEFTATSMIGFIALAGIIVRNSILLVDFTKHEVAAGRPVTDSVLLACKARTRPIVVTALALVGGSAVIIFDPIFKGMAISLAFGVIVSTILTLIIIPLGAISVRHSFAKKSLDPSGATVYADLPYDPILEGDYSEQPDTDSDKGLLDYISIALSFIWIFVLSMLLAFRDFMVDLTRALFRLFIRKNAQPVVKASQPAPDTGNKVTEETDIAKTSPANNEADSSSIQPRSKEVNQVVVAEKPSTETPVTVKDSVEKKPPAKKAVVKKTSVKQDPAKQTSAKQAVVKKPAVKKATPAKKSGRRGIRLKSDIDDE
ncbi:MAG: efflux RND transporter permease subunit, partial [Gammaproteobacteria bacterium]|nr:efflux RND transporter permease subunit [Gammaproteobacteria bacterium]